MNLQPIHHMGGKFAACGSIPAKLELECVRLGPKAAAVAASSRANVPPQRMQQTTDSSCGRYDGSPLPTPTVTPIINIM
jgi:hypothetical protein